MHACSMYFNRTEEVLLHTLHYRLGSHIATRQKTSIYSQLATELNLLIEVAIAIANWFLFYRTGSN